MRSVLPLYLLQLFVGVVHIWLVLDWGMKLTIWNEDRLAIDSRKRLWLIVLFIFILSLLCSLDTIDNPLQHDYTWELSQARFNPINFLLGSRFESSKCLRPLLRSKQISGFQLEYVTFRTLKIFRIISFSLTQVWSGSFERSKFLCADKANWWNMQVINVHLRSWGIK